MKACGLLIPRLSATSSHTHWLPPGRLLWPDLGPKGSFFIKPNLSPSSCGHRSLRAWADERPRPNAAPLVMVTISPPPPRPKGEAEESTASPGLPRNQAHWLPLATESSLVTQPVWVGVRHQSPLELDVGGCKPPACLSSAGVAPAPNL